MSYIEGLLKSMILKKLNANVAQKIAYRESKKSNSRIWGKQLFLEQCVPIPRFQTRQVVAAKLLEHFEFSFAIIML